MKFEQADYDKIRTSSTTDMNELGYMITLGGKPFKSYSGKCLFRTKQSAMCSLNNSIKWKVESIVKEKLKALGMTEFQIKRDAEYLGAYRNFIAQAKKDGFLKLITLS